MAPPPLKAPWQGGEGLGLIFNFYFFIKINYATSPKLYRSYYPHWWESWCLPYAWFLPLIWCTSNTYLTFLGSKRLPWIYLIGCQGVKLFLPKDYLKFFSLEIRICQKLSSWVLMPFEFFSFVTIWVWIFSPVDLLGYVTIWVLLVLKILEFLSFFLS